MTSETHLSELLAYDPETGTLTWKVRRGGIKAGSIAGSSDVDGYQRVMVNGKYVKAHRIAFLLMTGKWPKLPIDHINGVKDDNRWSNLREVPTHVNLQNRHKPNATNSTGLLGVFPRNGKFKAALWVGGKSKHLGTFNTAEEAHQRYLEEKRKQHEGCTI